ncbi:HIBADH [Branchiostoma lanceolatum]|uniref:HIBADH protein n=1 Tax=Branchiostoma lanceolatum TaxID=7740 RepID=A0A8J9YNZ0_BRALA|nr:HIBADH [Branchiostoma lanceolatum]
MASAVLRTGTVLKHVLQQSRLIQVATYNLKSFTTSPMTSNLASQHVGVIGGGNVGRAVALGLIKHGHKVTMYDPNTANKSEMEAHGATWATSSAEAGQAADKVLFTALPAPPEVRQVMEEDGVLDLLKPGSCWIDHTTTDHEETMRLCAKAQARGVDMLECPLTGGMELLKAGLMTVLVGGDKTVLNQYEPLIRSYTDTVLYMGPAGHASIVKVISNMLAGAHMVLTGEAAMIAKRNGVNLNAFWNGIRASAGNSFVFETEAPLMFNGTYHPGFAIKLHCKDLDLGRKLAFDTDVPIDLLSMTEQIYRRAMFRYGKDAGSSHPPKMLEEDLKVSLRTKGYDTWKYSIKKVESDTIAVVHHDIGEEAKNWADDS